MTDIEREARDLAADLRVKSGGWYDEGGYYRRAAQMLDRLADHLNELDGQQGATDALTDDMRSLRTYARGGQ
jgi:hypothetical protein